MLTDIHGKPLKNLATAKVVSSEEAERLRREKLEQDAKSLKRRVKWERECRAGEHGPWLQKVALRHYDNLTDCPSCDGGGTVWNNADPTSGQWAPCEACEDDRTHPV